MSANSPSSCALLGSQPSSAHTHPAVDSPSPQPGASNSSSPSSGQLFPVEDARIFLRLLGKDPTRSYFRTVTTGKGANRSRQGADLHGFNAEALDADNRAGSAVYVLVANAEQSSGSSGAVRDIDCVSFPALFVEWDDKSIEWQESAWLELGLLQPSFQVRSGGRSVHSYWAFNEPITSPDQWGALQRRLLMHCDADTSISNPSRVMRLPGFYYIDKATGQPGQLARLINVTEYRYSPEQLENCLPPEQIAAEHSIVAYEKNADSIPRHKSGPCVWPPRSLQQIEEAVAFIPQRVVGQNTYETSRRALCGCAAALAEINHPDPEGHALELLASKWPDRTSAAQALRSSTTREARSFWAIASEHGFDLRCRDLNRDTKRPRGFNDQSGRSNPRPKRRDPKKLSHARRMACFERCVEIQSKNERNSLRRRTRLLKAVKDLGLDRYIGRGEISQLVLQVKDRQHGNYYQGLNAADRLGMEWPEVEWLIPGLLPARDLNICGGRAKVGKTAFALAIGAAMLKGQPVAGFDAPNTTRPVIVVSDDQGDADTKQAMDQLGIFDHPRLIWSRRFRLTESNLDQLLVDVRCNPGALVIIDSLRSVSRGLGQDENDSEIGAVVYDLKAAVMDAGGSVLLIHHCNKAAGLVGVEALSGHNAIAGAANTVITLHYVEDAKGQLDKEADQRRMFREGRTGKGLDWVISRTPGTATFHKVDTWAGWQKQIEQAKTEAKREARQTNTQREVLELLQQRVDEWLTCRQVVEALGLNWGTGNGKDPNRVREALNALERADQVKRVRGDGQSYLYSVFRAADQPTHGTQLGSNTSTASEALSCNGFQSRGPISTTSMALPPAGGSEVVEVWPQLQGTLQRNGSDAIEAVEAVNHPVPAVCPLLTDLPAAMVGSGADVFDDGDDPAWGPRPDGISRL